VTPEDFLALDVAAKEAVITAVLARNGVEDLHADGAFDDAQAPTLNRLLRQCAAEVSYAAAISVDDGALEFVLAVADEGHEDAGDDLRMLCLTGAAARAVALFAERCALDDNTRDRLALGAQLGVLRQDEAEGFMQPGFGMQLFFSLIREWEPPEVSPEFRTRFLQG
jgi:hypothetical protein